MLPRVVKTTVPPRLHGSRKNTLNRRSAHKNQNKGHVPRLGTMQLISMAETLLWPMVISVMFRRKLHP